MKKHAIILILYIAICSSILYGYNNVLAGFNKPTYKSPDFARSFALGNVVIPIVPGILTNLMLEDEFSNSIGKSLLLYGVFIGPSAGNFYARDFIRGSSGILLRFITAGYILRIGTLSSMNSAFGGDSNSGGDILLIGSCISFLGSIGWNILSSSTSAIEYNNIYNLSIAPIYDIENENIGINLSIQF